MPHTRPHTCGVPGSFSLVRSLNAGAVVIASIVTAVGLPVAAFGQTPEETVDKLTPNRLLGDFIHYINIDDYKLAISVPQAKFISAVDRNGNAVAPSPSGTNYLFVASFDPLYSSLKP